MTNTINLLLTAGKRRDKNKRHFRITFKLIKTILPSSAWRQNWYVVAKTLTTS